MKCCDCPHPSICNPCEPEIFSYAQYGVQANPSSNTDLPMFVLSQNGEQISLANTEIELETGHLYLINFIFLATTEPDSFMQITPKINHAPNLFYSFFAPSGSSSRNTSASGSFTLAASERNVQLSFYLTYPESVRNIDISGTVSVTALSRIKPASKRGCIS